MWISFCSALIAKSLFLSKQAWSPGGATFLFNPYNPSIVALRRSVSKGEAPYLLTADATTDRPFSFRRGNGSPIFQSNLRSRMVLPMLVQGQVIGSLNISSHRNSRI